MKKLLHSSVPIFFFVLLSCIIFRQYFIKGYVPFPSNLLVAFYSPWRYYDYEGYPNGPANKPIGFDVLKLFYPYKSFTIDSLKQGIIPLWNPYNFSGNVHLATYQSAIFYPLNIIYFILPQIDAWSFLVIIQPVLSGFFTYLFLRLIRLNTISSLFGGVVFAFSGWMLAWSEESLVIEHTILWLPLMLFAVEKLYQKRSFISFCILIISCVMSFLAGFLQMTIYSFILVFIWVIFRVLQNNKFNRKYLYWCLLALILSLLISLVHLLPSYESYIYSPRGVVRASFVFSTYLMKPWHILTYLAPDYWGNPGSYNYFNTQGFYHEKVLFIGIPSLLLMLYAFFSKVTREIRLFKYVTIITLLSGFYPFGWLLYYSHIPIISAMIPSRIFAVTAFTSSLLVAGAVDLIWKDKVKHKIFIISVVIGLFLVATWIFTLLISIIFPKAGYTVISLRNLVIPTGLFIITCVLFIILRTKYKKISIIVLLLLTFISSSYFANKFLYFSERKFVFPDIPVLTKLKEISGHNRIWGYGNAYIEKNMTIFYKLYSPEGYDALYSQRYGELLFTQEKEGKITDQILRTDANIKQTSEREGILDNPYRDRLLELLSVRYILESKIGDGKEFSTSEKRFPHEYFKMIWEDDRFKIWEFSQALPRTLLISRYIVETDPQKIVDFLFDRKNNLRQSLVLEEQPNIQNMCDESNNDTSEFTKYSANEIEVAVNNNNCSALLFLSDTYYPGWHAYLDGRETPIYRANYAFRAVSVPSGEHRVQFLYRPLSFDIGFTGSILGILLIVPVYYFIKRYA